MKKSLLLTLLLALTAVTGAYAQEAYGTPIKVNGFNYTVYTLSGEYVLTQGGPTEQVPEYVYLPGQVTYNNFTYRIFRAVDGCLDASYGTPQTYGAAAVKQVVFGEGYEEFRPYVLGSQTNKVTVVIPSTAKNIGSTSGYSSSITYGEDIIGDLFVLADPAQIVYFNITGATSAKVIVKPSALSDFQSTWGGWSSQYATEFTVSTAKEYTTFSRAFDVDLSGNDGVQVFTAKKTDDNTVTLTEVEDKYIPANTGVILKGVGNFTATIGEKTGVTLADNELVAALGTTAIEADAAYILSDGAFHPASAGKIDGNKAYLAVAASSAKPLNIAFAQPTGINTVATKANAENAPVYNLAGQRVGKDYKGVVIQNGVKKIQK